jgi:alpha-glucosidase
LGVIFDSRGRFFRHPPADIRVRRHLLFDPEMKAAIEGKRGVDMTGSLKKTCAILMLTILTGCSGRGGGEERMVSVRSPDGKNVITVEHLGTKDRNSLTYSIERDGKKVVDSSAIRVVLSGKGQVAEGARLRELKEDRLDETFSPLWGKSRIVRNVFSEVQLRLESSTGILWDLELRAYDDGVAFRYGFPDQEGISDFVLGEESTEIRMEGNPSVLYLPLPSFTTPHENLYEHKLYSELPEETLIDTPFLAVWPDGPSAVLTEARLRDFAGMYLQRIPGEVSPTLGVVLSPLPSQPEARVIGRTPHWSPWRVMLLADEAGQHLESNLLVCLNDPPQGDFSWIRPGKSTWHWWNGTAEEGLPFPCGMNYETHKHYIDFCARHGIAFHAVVADDRPWYQQSTADFAPGPDTDILTPRPELELSKILAYAEQRGIGIRLWVHWLALNERLEEAFTRYEEWGIRGLMVDFLDRNDQEMVLFCERVLESATRHKLHIQFHGSYMPSGEHRTFPNLFNREGVLNLEYLKWSARCTPQHNIDVAYTRNLAGPTDYHLGGFRAVPADRFQPRNIMPNILGSRCHHLAMYVVYENPMPMVCDTPSSYEGQAGFDFLKQVPTTWDETRFLRGQEGEFVVMARRKDRTWYLGGMTNDVGRKISVPLHILGPGEYEAEIFVDGSLSGDEPNAIRLERQAVTAGISLEVTMAPGGGFVAVIHPKSVD